MKVFKVLLILKLLIFSLVSSAESNRFELDSNDVSIEGVSCVPLQRACRLSDHCGLFQTGVYDRLECNVEIESVCLHSYSPEFCPKSREYSRSFIYPWVSEQQARELSKEFQSLEIGLKRLRHEAAVSGRSLVLNPQANSPHQILTIK